MCTDREENYMRKVIRRLVTKNVKTWEGSHKLGDGRPKTEV